MLPDIKKEVYSSSPSKVTARSKSVSN